MEFAYLDLIEPSITFDPVITKNWFKNSDEKAYALFTAKVETDPFIIPGYYGYRCIIEIEMAKALIAIQHQLLLKGLSLKVYDAYRPQKTSLFLNKWVNFPDTPLAKQFHYPHMSKKALQELFFLDPGLSHALGTGIDVTIMSLDPPTGSRPDNFLGYFDDQSVDMGVGYLCFDERSSHSYQDLTPKQKENRQLLASVMLAHGFELLDTDIFHYFYCQDRNKTMCYDFDIFDHYKTKKGVIFKEYTSVCHTTGES